MPGNVNSIPCTNTVFMSKYRQVYRHSHGNRMDDTVIALCDFFNRELPRLETTYQWKIPNIQGFSKCGESGFLQNLALKKQKWYYEILVT